MLELASGASMGTITGLGGGGVGTTSFNNFATVVFDSGAQWLLVGDTNMGEVKSGFTFGDTIDLTGFKTRSAGPSPTMFSR